MQTKPLLILVFGATGDLAQKKVFPALSSLHQKNLIPKGSKIIGVSRRSWSDEEFKKFLPETLSANFLKDLSYVQADVEKDYIYKELHDAKEAFIKANPDGEVIAYLALAPHHHERKIRALFRSEILSRGKGKLLIEKPFGINLETAKLLNQTILELTTEDIIYRIDHYLGKDGIRGFKNNLDKAAIESLTISLSEKKSIDGRGASYDGVGAFRDVGQNHILEVLGTILADDPTSQDSRAQVLKQLLPPKDTCELSRRGQYIGYETEKGVPIGSQTETAFEVITAVNKIPVTLRAGKMLQDDKAFALIKMHGESSAKDIHIDLRKGDAYENVFMSAFRGERQYFVGAQEIEAAWTYADKVVACWNKVPLEPYSITKPFLVE